MVRHARAEAGVRGEEAFHLLMVAGQDHDQIVALVFHHLQQDLDRLLPIVALILGTVKIIGFVDEQHAAHRALQHLLGLGRGVADILADQIVARHRHQMPPPDIAQPVEDRGHPQRDRRLAGARIAGEAHVQGRRVAHQPQPLADAIDQQQRGDVADALLDRRKAHQLAVQRVEIARQPAFGELLPQVDRVIRHSARPRADRPSRRAWYSRSRGRRAPAAPAGSRARRPAGR